jgi:hypothetical protein
MGLSAGDIERRDGSRKNLHCVCLSAKPELIPLFKLLLGGVLLLVIAIFAFSIWDARLHSHHSANALLSTVAFAIVE